MYKFNFAKNDKKRILFLNTFFAKKINKKTFSKQNLWKFFYHHGKQSLLDLLNYQILKSQKKDNKLLDLIVFFKDKDSPKLPIKAETLMNEFNMSEGKELGLKLKMIEDKWISNNFNISDNEIKKLILD